MWLRLGNLLVLLNRSGCEKIPDGYYLHIYKNSDLPDDRECETWNEAACIFL